MATPTERHEKLEQLRKPVQYLRGVGSRRADKLAKLGLRTALDLVFFFPRDYQQIGAPRAIETFVEGETVSTVAEVIELSQRTTMKGVTMVSALLGEGERFLRVVWFNQPFIRKNLYQGQRLLVTGVPKSRGLTWEMRHPSIAEIRSDEELPKGQILPVYRLTDGIKQPQMRQIVWHAVEKFSNELEEVLPDEFREEHRLWPIGRAVQQIHRPDDEASLADARRRFVFQELLVLQLALAIRRQHLQTQQQAAPLPVDTRLDARIRSRFPFELTAGQRKAIDEIAQDFARSQPMNRLLQGDVGCGKTVVAIYAMLTAVAHGKQAVLMAPTEVLARQHHRNLERLLTHAPTDVGLLTGGLSKGERSELLERLRDGSLPLVIGTQAIIQEGVEFHDLAVVVVDEQHKFGVRQRFRLKQAGRQPHYLVMTATPIPRTLSMSLFGDLDVSLLREKPPGRRQVHTYVGWPDQRDSWWQFFRKKLREGRQGYVITPLVEESDEQELASVVSSFEELANGELADFRIDLLHGRMSNEQKDEVMFGFATGETQVLVATSVVEVGVDVPNATLMTIESSERFGLSQLHQLRGRVSRGQFDGYVCAFVGRDVETRPERLEAFAKSTDGFDLAELDFKLRGPGNVLGTKQHGLPPLRIADLHRDAKILEEARQVAFALIDQVPDLQSDTWASLRRMVITRYGRVLNLSDVG